MEMQSRESLRRIHGVNVRPARARRPVSKLGYADSRREAGVVRGWMLLGALKAVAMFVRKTMIDPVRREMRRRRDVHHLMQMSDHQLRDIGLDRNEIHYRVYHGRPEDR